MTTIPVNGATLNVRCDGERSRPAVVFSNSLGTDLSMWDAQAAVLATRFYVVRYDTRGHGGSVGTSGAPAGPYTVELLGSDVLGLLDHLDIERAHFVGLSMGGVIGQWLGAHAPGRLQKLVLANTASKIGTREGWQARAAAVRAEGMNEIAAGSPSRWFTPGFVGRQPVVVGSMQKTVRGLDPEGYAACCEALAMADLTPDLRRIEASTLVIAGTDDPVTTVAHACALTAAIKGATMATLPASHLSNVEAPDRFTDAVASFLLA
ncbi:3-oxoadipate enol-lactonase [Massilia litorea]|uniref:3-oxoadipate enol-lactonase n=1 Tax=Massilia litorea TaxID=2769491 RepID=A0A7L9U4L5_9BURK|nr:3-oxoadipate enol-lactonase [Massilia litorea]QOL48976.1 3-oxoadipate enol-lactonase [Massilia litorea]